MNLLGIFVLLACATGLQLVLAARQSKAYLREVMALRRLGHVAIGLGGRKWFGRRAYVALASNPDGEVVAALALRGLTQWAKAKPRPALVGLTTAELAGAASVPRCDSIERSAARQAAQTLNTAGGWQPTGGVLEGKESAAPASSPE